MSYFGNAPQIDKPVLRGMARNRYTPLAGLLTLLCLGCAVATVGGRLGQFDWRLDLLAHFDFYTLFLLTLADGGLFFLGFRRLAALFTPFLLLHIASVGPFLVPRWPAAHTGPMLEIVLFNVNQGNQHYAEVREFIARQSPDLVVLQEINPEWVHNLTALSGQFPYHIEHPRNDYYGLAVYSKTSLQQKKLFIAEASPSLEFTLSWQAQLITVFVVHPPPPLDARHTAWRNDQLVRLADSIALRDGGKILLGDLNTTPWSWIYRELETRSGLVNCSQGHGINATWPTTSRWLRIPLDHCLHSPAFDVESVQVGQDLGSDHLPLVVRLGFESVQKKPNI